MYKIFDEFGISSSLRSPRGAAKGFVWNRTPEEPDEGVTGEVDSDGAALERAVSITEVKITDAISEGEIEGLVEGEYEGIASGGVAGGKGQVGWDTVKYHENAKIKPNADDIYDGVKWLPSVIYDDVPVVNSVSEFNFQQFQIKQSKGTTDGVIDDGISSPLTIHRQIGERLRGGGVDFGKTYRINNRDCKGVAVTIKIVSLSYTEKEDVEKYGDKLVTSVDYEIEYRPIFTTEAEQIRHSQNFSPLAHGEVTGYVNSAYLKQVKVQFPQDFSNYVGFIGWEIKIWRRTEDSLSTTIQNQTYIDGFYEIYGNTFTYPNTAMVEHHFSAEYFGSDTPKRIYDIRGLKVKLPTDYDPISKTYHGGTGWYAHPHWNGVFKTYKQWTDNPAWIFYDLMTNRRYGLGQYIHSDVVDKWTLYEIAKYCDELVEDGYGGLEPRFTCSMVIKNRDAAYKVVQDLASMFRAITYFQGGNIYLSQDARKSPVYQFTNANVKDGDFIYQSSASRARRTVGIVRYRNKKEDFKQAVEYVEDIEGIRKFGIREIEIAGVGVTSRGQAVRYGNWMLLSEQMDQESVSFTTGMEATILKPGDIISIQDQHRGVRRYGGRTVSIVNSGSGVLWDHTASFYVWPKTVVTLDTEISEFRAANPDWTGFASNDTFDLVLLTPTYQYDPSRTKLTSTNDTGDIRRSQLQTLSFDASQVSYNSEGQTVITFDHSVRSSVTGLAKDGYEYASGLVWAMEPTGVTKSKFTERHSVPTEWKVLNVAERDNEYSISCIEYNDKKFDLLEGIADFDDENADPVVVPPTSITLSQRSVTANTKEIMWTIIPGNITNVRGYYVYMKQGEWTGADFVETDPNRTSEESALATAPDSKYLIKVHSGSMGDLAGDNYFPSINGTVNVRCYSYNIAGRASESSVNSSISISGVNPVFDTHINSLTITNVTDGTSLSQGEIDPGTRGVRTHDLAEPNFGWKINVAGRVNPSVKFNYKVTIRPQSRDNIPQTQCYLTYQGHNEASTDPTSTIGKYLKELDNIGPGQLSFEFDIDKNIEGLGVSGGAAGLSLRNYDVVVEAINDAGQSSAGVMYGNYVQNPFGYDVLEVNNPNIGRVDLTPEEELENCENAGGYGGATFCSDQYLDLSGNVYIAYKDKSPDTTTHDLDVLGGILLIAPAPFVTRDYHGTLDGRLMDPAFRDEIGVQMQSFVNNSNAPNKINIIAGFIAQKAHISIAYTDTYDSLLREKLGDGYVLALLFTDLTNVVEIKIRAAIAGLIGGGGYDAYIGGEWSGIGGTITNIRCLSNLALMKTRTQYAGVAVPVFTETSLYTGSVYTWMEQTGATVADGNFKTYSIHGRTCAILRDDRSYSWYYGHPGRGYSGRLRSQHKWDKTGASYIIWGSDGSRMEDGYSLAGDILYKMTYESDGRTGASGGHYIPGTRNDLDFTPNYEIAQDFVWTLFFEFDKRGVMANNRYYIQMTPPISWAGSTNNPHPHALVGIQYFESVTDESYLLQATVMEVFHGFYMNNKAGGSMGGKDCHVVYGQAKDGFFIKMQVSAFDTYAFKKRGHTIAYWIGGVGAGQRGTGTSPSAQQVFIGVLKNEVMASNALIPGGGLRLKSPLEWALQGYPGGPEYVTQY